MSQLIYYEQLPDNKKRLYSKNNNSFSVYKKNSVLVVDLVR